MVAGGKRSPGMENQCIASTTVLIAIRMRQSLSGGGWDVRGSFELSGCQSESSRRIFSFIVSDSGTASESVAFNVDMCHIALGSHPLFCKGRWCDSKKKGHIPNGLTPDLHETEILMDAFIIPLRSEAANI